MARNGKTGFVPGLQPIRTCHTFPKHSRYDGKDETAPNSCCMLRFDDLMQNFEKYDLKGVFSYGLTKNRDRKIRISVKPSLDAREALDDLQCPSRAEQAIQPATNDIITYRRGEYRGKNGTGVQFVSFFLQTTHPHTDAHICLMRR